MSAEPPTAGKLEKWEEDAFPNLFRFMSEPGKRCNAEIDVVRFFESKPTQFHSDMHNDPKAETRQPEQAEIESAAAELFIIEDLDERHIRRFLETRVTPNHRSSFLKFLDDYLDDNPSYNFEDVLNHIPPLPSTIANQQHVAFHFNSAREFDRVFELTYKNIRPAAKAGGSWRNDKCTGPMVPVQRRELSGEESLFPPVALTRVHIAAWFDVDSSPRWRTGIILVDRALRVRGLPGKLRPSCHIVAGHRYSNYESYRTLLLQCMRRNNGLTSAGVPAPFVALQDVYRLMGYQWMLINTYVTRDLNIIEWELQGGSNNHHNTPDQFKTTLRSLFFIRRRINLYRGLLQKQLTSCRHRGRSSWNRAYDPDSVQMKVADQVAKELVEDYTQIESLMSHCFERLEQGIRHIASEASIKETERANELNRILLVLAFVATFFLPINTLAAMVNMTGDWAPQHANFGLFWAICIPISALLTALLLALRYWESITRRLGRLRHRKPGGPAFQSMI